MTVDAGPTPAEIEARVFAETGVTIEVLYTCPATDGSGNIVVVLRPPPLTEITTTLAFAKGA